MRNAMERFKGRMKKIKEDIFVIAEAVKHPETPFYIKVLALIVVAYAFSPIDLIPDFIPVLGYLDDLILVPLGIAVLLKLLPDHIIQESREIVAANGKVKKKNWLAGAVILLLWAAAIYWLVGLLVQIS